ncbi:MAG: glutaminase [Nitriliruptoraceae bacterium]
MSATGPDRPGSVHAHGPGGTRPAPLPLAEGVIAAAELARPAAADGQVADYIAPLATVDPWRFALVVSQLDGAEHLEGDGDETFAIQSISKVFSLVLALRSIEASSGVEDDLWCRVGREPSGDPFNSLVQLERERGIPRNPMINAGAIVVDDVLLDRLDDPVAATCELLSELCGEPVELDQEVLRAEQATAHRNRSLAHLMADFGNLHHDLEVVLASYIGACAISMTARQLARAMRFLANDGVDPVTGRRVLAAPLARRVAALMLTCGTYDAAGEFAFSVGLPCKSGVAGAIVAVVPDRAAACVWSPPLDHTGNSVAGRIALHELAERCALSVF